MQLPAPISATAFISLADSQLWDFAGVDGLPLAKALVGARADRLAPFQSLETTIDGQPCSLLRLCEGNFRVRVWGEEEAFAATLQSLQFGLRVWVKQCEWMEAIALPESVGLMHLSNVAIPKPPHRLEGMVGDRALPARIDGFSVLLWRHVVGGQPAFELQTATKHLATIQATFTSCCSDSNSLFSASK
ncbi:hypothetical protein C7B82_00360 [Stenomitos frigidus ULC18]|uniref:Sarcosine oxidase subunit gamma n=2 Tax=Stenomitos TaxID=1844270 RepID=A0A2T1ESK6_9CYAN|nr:hypothetical protein C7B82_00360 [Stenomitos frigidus ULC18]